MVFAITTITASAQYGYAITINNAGYDAKVVEIYTSSNQYIGSLRIPGGRSSSFSLGAHEGCYNYSYKVRGSYGITSFYNYNLTIY